MNNIVPMTIDEINNLRGMDRANAIAVRKAWLAKQRKQDRKEQHIVDVKKWLVKVYKDPVRHDDLKVKRKQYAKNWLLKIQQDPKKYAKYLKRRRICNKNRHSRTKVLK